MFDQNFEAVRLYILICTLLILVLTTFVLTIIYRYQQKQNLYFKEKANLSIQHENQLLQSQIEMQEQTFQNISRDIHDNIGQKLSLAKLWLNTLTEEHKHTGSEERILTTASIIGDVINELSDLGRSMSSEFVLNKGLVAAVENELMMLSRTGRFNVSFTVKGESVYLEDQVELVLFRIIQEGLNNIIKHAAASFIKILMYYTDDALLIELSDNGIGFNTEDEDSLGLGLKNILKRVRNIKGHSKIVSQNLKGTTLTIKIPTS